MADQKITPERITSEQVQEAPRTTFVLDKGLTRKLTKASTTPDVKNTELCQAQNTGAVTVIDFLNGQNGQHLYILGDGFTTVADNTNIKTNTGANKLLAVDFFYHFLNYLGVWVEQEGGSAGVPGPPGSPGAPGGAGPPGLPIEPDSPDVPMMIPGSPGAPGAPGIGIVGPMGPPGSDGDPAEDSMMIPGPLGAASTVPGPTGPAGATGRPGMDADPQEEMIYFPGVQGSIGLQGVQGSQAPWIEGYTDVEDYMFFPPGNLVGGGTPGVIPKFISGSQLGNSVLSESGGNILVAGALLPDADNTRILGFSPGARWNAIYGANLLHISNDGQIVSVSADTTHTVRLLATNTNATMGTSSNHDFEIQSNSISRWVVKAAGHLVAFVDNTYDIGAAGATRPKDLYLAGKATVGGAFGCNTKAAQTAFASGGAVVPGAGAFGASSAALFANFVTLVTNIRLALVANGIMS